MEATCSKYPFNANLDKNSRENKLHLFLYTNIQIDICKKELLFTHFLLESGCIDSQKCKHMESHFISCQQSVLPQACKYAINVNVSH